MFPHLIVISETGSTVTATKGSTTITARETSTDHFECDLVTPNPQDTYGTWVIHAILNGDDAQANLVVDAVKVYTVDDEHFHADIIVTYPDGAVVSCTKDGLSPMYATSSPYTFTVHSIGMYTIAGERDDITEIVEVDITTNGQTINITLDLLPDGETVTPTDDVQTLLLCAGIDDKPYTTISALIADDTTLLKVITHDNAIDYLVRSTTFASAITADSDAMAMIGSYDYASDTLLADSTWAMAITDSTYASSVINISTPKMTSDNTPSGVCSAKTTAGSSYPAWKAFDKDNSSIWASATNPSDDYLRYKFAKAVGIGFVKIKTVYSGSLRLKTLSIKASNDNFSTSETLMATVTLTNQNVEDYLYPVSPSTKFDSFGIENLTTYQSDVEIKELDFLGRQNGGVQSWLRSGGITDKTYTTLAEVLADTTTLSALIANHDAVDYLVTAKGLIDGIVADATAMSYIGLNNYCSNTLLADAEWLEAIVNSTYKESVLNVKVPTMTSDTTPSGKCGATSVASSSFHAFNAFDGITNGAGSSGIWAASPIPNQIVWYDFERKVRIYAVKFYPVKSSNYNASSKDWDIVSSDDETVWNTEASGTNGDALTPIDLVIANPSDAMQWGCKVKTSYRENQSYAIAELVLYGREDV